MKASFFKASVFAVTVAALLTNCTNDDDDFTGPSAINDTAITVPFFTINENGQIPTAADELIYEIRKQEPVLAPDGHHLTWGEFSTVKGKAEVKCKGNGVEATLELSGLIPNGVYTIWNVVFDAPGVDPTDPMLGLEGMGAAGIGDGSDNAFTASNQGTASITIFSPGGPLSVVSNTNLGNCPLTENFEWHIVGGYHMDGQTHGPVLGPDGTAIEQFGFIFKEEIN